MLTAGSTASRAATPAPQPHHKPVSAAPKAAPKKQAPKKEASAAKPAAKKAVPPQEAGSVSSLPVPRYVTLGADEVNLRTGPGFRYPIRLVIRKSGLPVEIMREFDVWRQIRDRDGAEGWVHKSMLSGRRTVVIMHAVQTLLDAPHDGARPVVRLEPGVIAGLSTCQDTWCRLKVASYEGWLKRSDVWGVYPRETFQQ
ncbi:MAG: hypothetical protein GC185_10560 [Alphaproteobacteria bacterium]|nr:hypothetical protein [Alphaproteobacteria bacterium]